MSYLATLKRSDDGYEDAEGVFFPTAAAALGELLGFCGCGRPEDALRYVRDAMRLLEIPRPGAGGAWCPDMVTWAQWTKETYRPVVDAVFRGNSGAEYLMWYLLDDKELLEHGSSVPGWLTDLGKDVLADLNAMDFGEAKL